MEKAKTRFGIECIPKPRGGALGARGGGGGGGLPRSNFALELVEALELLLFHAVQFADSGRKDGHQVALAVHVERVEQMVQRLFRPNMFDDTIKKNVQNKKQKKTRRLQRPPTGLALLQLVFSSWNYQRLE